MYLYSILKHNISEKKLYFQLQKNIILINMFLLTRMIVQK
jgi:hypothetical protein